MGVLPPPLLPRRREPIPLFTPLPFSPFPPTSPFPPSSSFLRKQEPTVGRGVGSYSPKVRLY